MALPVNATVRGGRETAAAFDKLADDVADLSATHEKVARARLDGVASRTPVRSGALAGSWEAAGAPEFGSILSPLPYAGPIEWGVFERNISPAGMIARTLEAEQQQLAHEYEAAILEAAKRRASELVEPRRVTVTLPAIKGLTMLEIARASVAAGVARSDTERLLRTLIDPTADPHELELGALLLYAWAWQLVKRDEPGATWEDAQTWRVEFDLGESADDTADAEAEAAVYAAVATGLPPREAAKLTVAEMGVYAELAERRG